MDVAIRRFHARRIRLGAGAFSTVHVGLLVHARADVSWERGGRPSSKVERCNGTRSRIAVPEQLERSSKCANVCTCMCCIEPCTRHAYATREADDSRHAGHGHLRQQRRLLLLPFQTISNVKF